VSGNGENHCEGLVALTFGSSSERRASGLLLCFRNRVINSLGGKVGHLMSHDFEIGPVDSDFGTHAKES
jgi:hypothetical protein